MILGQVDIFCYRFYFIFINIISPLLVTQLKYYVLSPAQSKQITTSMNTFSALPFVLITPYLYLCIYSFSVWSLLLEYKLQEGKDPGVYTSTSHSVYIQFLLFEWVTAATQEAWVLTYCREEMLFYIFTYIFLPFDSLHTFLNPTQLTQMD